MNILIQNGHIIDPANGIDQIGDIRISEGKIISATEDFQADKTVDASNLIVCPGLVDMRARLREPGQTHKGTIESETRAAASAGVTTLCIPPDTQPIIDTPAVIELIRNRAKDSGYASVIPLGALTHGLDGEHLSNMGALKEAGCAGVSNAQSPISNSLVMRRALEYAASHELTVFLHSADPWLTNSGCVHEGTVSTRLGLPGIPDAAEAAGVARDLVLIRETGVRAHFCGISSLRALQMIELAQKSGLPVSVDVAVHHLYLTEMDIGEFNSLCHVLPPLRTERDRAGLVNGVLSSTIQAICSDHQPHDEDAKAAPFEQTEPGISSVETLLPLTLRLAKEHDISISDAISMVTNRPAEILGIDAGTLGEGRSADITIFDPEAWWTVTTESLQSTGKNSPFLNWELQGRVTHTIMGGNIVHES
ncbi:MAG: dihydroorotase [Gammaproteobacteria bacterium]|uniref:Dihydroorotase n=1 Tax=Candidatus Thiopontia autotrophica TaxID=2841688 RepID=A0A8J6P3Z8_9GAMM|nr:dihydroorotase [Candidatus Thiopontia autotrophica]MBL6969283.1 dihydroorotase [Gammaproteobacteria bacterium]